MPVRPPYLWFPLLSLVLLSGCEQLGIEDPAKMAAAKEAEGRAVGSACRHSGRALEDCYRMNPKAQKAAIFAGWRDMDAYMRENKIEVVRPDVAEPVDGKSAQDEKGTAENEAGKTAADGKEEKHSTALTLPQAQGRRVVG